jgi:antitoxin CptB
MQWKGYGKSAWMPGIWRCTPGGEEPMTGTTRSSDGLDIRRRKLLFRCWHRGMRELDLIMGRFADNAIDALTADELVQFEGLIEVPDRELLAWVTGEIDVPAAHDTPLFQRLRDFNLHGEGAR